MNRTNAALPLSLFLALMMLVGCGGSCLTNAQVTNPAPLSVASVNLIFVVSEDLSYQAPGDINPATANLTDRGLQRSLLMGTFLKQHVLGGNNVTSIHALEPMTHLQTASKYPDLVALETIQQFAMLNQVTLAGTDAVQFTANSFPIFSAYSPQSLPLGVAQPVYPCAACQGLDFTDQGGDNEAVVSGIVSAKAAGYHVFSAPWETTSELLAAINRLEGFRLNLPAAYKGPNYVYAISIDSSGSASLVTYNSNLAPPANYPALPPITSTACTAQPPFTLEVTGGIGGAVIPVGINTRETVYMIRHTEAHPTPAWEDGNYVGAGQWRALNLPNALRGKIFPTQVYSIDPALGIPVGVARIASSYVRAAMTVEPYAIANNLPYNLAASVAVFAQNPPQLSTAASEYFFLGGGFSNQRVLMAWEHLHIPPTVGALVSSYFPNGGAPPSRHGPTMTMTPSGQ